VGWAPPRGPASVTRFSQSKAFVQRLVDHLEWRARREEATVAAARSRACARAGVAPPVTVPFSRVASEGDEFLVDTEAMRAVSDLVRATHMSLEATIRLWRGESVADSRPNKALQADHLEWLLHGFEQQDVVLSTIRVGVQHPFRPWPLPAHGSPTLKLNHKSAQQMQNALLRSIREGQDAGTYLVVSADAVPHWKHLLVSPFRCVIKAGADPRLEARAIHDLASPQATRRTISQCKTRYPF
jgi:hypothetical protein